MNSNDDKNTEEPSKKIDALVVMDDHNKKHKSLIVSVFKALIDNSPAGQGLTTAIRAVTATTKALYAVALEADNRATDKLTTQRDSQKIKKEFDSAIANLSEIPDNQVSYARSFMRRMYSVPPSEGREALMRAVIVNLNANYTQTITSFSELEKQLSANSITEFAQKEFNKKFGPKSTMQIELNSPAKIERKPQKRSRKKSIKRKVKTTTT